MKNQTYIFHTHSLNIYPTDYCNKRCCFCKLKEILTTKENSNEMKIDDLDKIIDFAKRSKISKLRILGGEPSHHSQIVEFIERIYEKGLSVPMIFTNGLFENDKLIKCILEHHIKVNLNYLSIYTNEESKLVNKNIKKIVGRDKRNSSAFYLSITFYRPDQDYKYIIDTCMRYNIRAIRWALSEKSMLGGNMHVTWQELRTMVPLILKFVKELINLNIYNEIECNLITPCVLTTRELTFFRKYTSGFGYFKCLPILDIFPDLTVHYCMGMPIINNITAKNTIQEMFFVQMLASEYFRKKPIAQKCLECKWRQNRSCQGFCLQFKYDENNSRDRKLLNEGLEWLNNRR